MSPDTPVTSPEPLTPAQPDAPIASPRRRREWWAIGSEVAVLAALFFFYLGSFKQSSPVNGPFEVFAQDSVFILDSLADAEPYPWNPQSHILYHYAVERGHQVWQHFFGPGRESTYRYLKLFTALCGLGFLACMRALFRELKVPLAGRIVLLLLSGFTVSAWFHFAAFETHCLALPALALYLVAVARLRNRPTRTLRDRAMLIGSLVVCGWTRVDLFRFAAVSALLPALPGVRKHRRSLATDLALVGLLWAAGNVWLAHVYLDEPLREAATAAFERHERRSLSQRMGRIANLEPQRLLEVARAVSLYSIAMPVERRTADRSFLAPPAYTLDLKWPAKGRDLPSTGLFREPARNMLGTALSFVTLALVAATFLWASAMSVRRAVAGDVLHAMLLAHALAGWLLYTWFNPLEPFLWILEFMPLWIAMLADNVRGRGRTCWVALSLVTLCVALHNWFAFYVPFR